MPTRREFLKLAAAAAAALALPLPSLAEQELTIALKNQSLMMIDNAGISSVNVRKRLEEVYPDYYASYEEANRRAMFTSAVRDELRKLRCSKGHIIGYWRP